ncbi:DUF11 domain-containing protein [Qipengyuania sp. 6B39]|uniref:DUF11 domain-containing protein n=1 Tax=Qipengyuania proteolytica TaxID=2867239 RepID=UPI001C88FB05|nr:DUF11 domain-containing protein [Qipengyuania proteolytica]MBX7495783.1 DUF11 domain-containing protein [Qipengyuania proteolytica]
MTRTSRLLGAVSTIALVALSANPALAEGTDAGTAIQNTVSVTFDVGGVTQDPVDSNTDEFLVDRRVNLTVEEVGGAATIVSPGSTQQVTTFTVTNLSNDTVDYALTVDQQAGGTSAFGGTDTFDTGTTTIYLDDGDGVFDPSTDTLVTYIDELAADTSATVFVVTDIPLGQVTGDIATVVLTADAHEGGATGSLGAELTTSATNTVDAVDTVLADGSGATDADYDGAFSARDDYQVLAAALSVLKTSRIVSDPITDVTGGTPKAIPGAVIEYCIAVSNASGGAPATNIVVTDPLPANTTFEAGSILLDGTVSSGTCNLDGSAGGSYDGTNVTGALSDIAAGDTATLVFRAVID